MNDLVNRNGPLTMSSREIAGLTGKRHTHVMVDCRKLAEFYAQEYSTEISAEYIKNGFYQDSTGRSLPCFELNKQASIDLITGYSLPHRHAVNKRWQELETQQGLNIPQTANPQTQALINTLLRLDQVEERQQALQSQIHHQAHANQVLEDRVSTVELQHRNGVPAGYLSKGDAYSLYGIGLSEEIFYMVLKHFDVECVNYIHTGKDGFTTPSIAYRNNGTVRAAIEMFVDDAVQVTKCFCESPMLNGKRFRYIKEHAA